MRLHNRTLATLFLAGQISIVTAEILESGAYRTANPGSPYPPSCITNPLQSLDLTANNVVQFFSERIRLEVAGKIETTDPSDNIGEVQLDMYRVGCAEPNRSVVIAEFRLPAEWVDPRKSTLILPWLAGNSGFDPFPFQFKSEANSWGQSQSQFLLTRKSLGDYTGGWEDPRGFSWRYVLDVHGEGWGSYSPVYYNDEFVLLFFRNSGNDFLSVVVPSTDALFDAPSPLPLNGRLSGNWVEEGAADQGFLVSFNTPPPPAEGIVDPPAQAELLVFLSWFTFDAEGNQLWLTGAKSLPQGSSEVTVPIEAVKQGTFLGDTPAQRSTVGTARLRAIECNRIELEYDLGELGLGSDVVQLRRLFALEIADYPCRDYEGLQTSIYPAQPN